MPKPIGSTITSLLTLALLCSSASAAWPPAGKPVATPLSPNGIRWTRIAESPSGDLSLFYLGNGGNQYQAGVTRWQQTGDVSPGWPSAGVTLISALKSIGPYQQGFAVSDAGEVWHSNWFVPVSSGSVQLEVVTAAGAREPASVGGWVPSTSSSPCRMALALGAVGDAYSLTNAGRLQRTYRNGVRAVGWPTIGRTVPSGSFSLLTQTLAPDGHGGVLAMGYLDPRPAVLRVDSTGAVSPGWPGTGRVLSSDMNGDPSGDLAEKMALIPSGSDHWIAVWLSTGDPASPPETDRRVMAQRFAADGTLDPAWPADGLELAPSDVMTDFTVLSDGGSGAYVLWNSPGGPVGTHVLSDGSTPPGLAPGGGALLVDAAAVYVQPGLPLFPTLGLGNMVAAVRPGGGLLFAWSDARHGAGTRFRVRWLRPDLTPDTSRPDTGVVVLPNTSAPYRVRATGLRAVHSDALDGAFLAWEVLNDAILSSELWMTHVGDPATTAAPPRPGSSALALATPRPNPSRGSIALDATLTNDGEAMLELLDVAGRTLRSQHVAGAGMHTLTFDHLAALPPGLYFARLRLGADARVVRFVLAR